MMMRILPKLLKLIKENKKFLIVSHINPEGDAIGSSIALALGLKKLGKYVYVLNKNPVPEILKFLPRSDLINTRVPRTNFDVLFLVDCSTLERTGFSASGGSDQGGKKLKAKATAIIDHHLTTGKDRNPLSMIDPEASATGELVYKLLNALNVPLDRKIATNLYAAILTDTGGFRYSNTGIESLSIASKLIEAGANTSEIIKEIYETIPFRCMKLLAFTLSTLEKEGKIAWVTITQRMFKNTNTTAEDTENFADHPRKVKGVEVGVLFREDRRNSYKISLRSKGKVNVADIARAFGGGGHASAAGCNLRGPLPEVRKKVLNAVRNAIKTVMSNA